MHFFKKCTSLRRFVSKKEPSEEEHFTVSLQEELGQAQLLLGKNGRFLKINHEMLEACRYGTDRVLYQHG
jgi:hypothetical protein